MKNKTNTFNKKSVTRSLSAMLLAAGMGLLVLTNALSVAAQSGFRNPGGSATSISQEQARTQIGQILEDINKGISNKRKLLDFLITVRIMILDLAYTNITANPHFPADTKLEWTGLITAHIQELRDLQTELTNLPAESSDNAVEFIVTKAKIVSNNFDTAWKTTVTNFFVSRTDHVIAAFEKVAGEVEGKIAELQIAGVDTADFTSQLNAIKSDIASAKAIFAEAKKQFSENKIKQGYEILVPANGKLTLLIKRINNKTGGF